MKLNWRCLFALVSGMVFVQSPVLAVDCDEMTREAQASGFDRTYVETTVVGIIHDARSHGLSEEQMSEFTRDQNWAMFRSSKWGPYLVVVEEGTNRVFPFYVRDVETFEEGVQRMASVIGRRVKVAGCLVGRDNPDFILPTSTDVELLE